jgi:hypothetical protein
LADYSAKEKLELPLGGNMRDIEAGMRAKIANNASHKRSNAKYKRVWNQLRRQGTGKFKSRLLRLICFILKVEPKSRFRRQADTTPPLVELFPNNPQRRVCLAAEPRFGLDLQDETNEP